MSWLEDAIQVLFREDFEDEFTNYENQILQLREELANMRESGLNLASMNSDLRDENEILQLEIAHLKESLDRYYAAAEARNEWDSREADFRQEASRALGLILEEHGLPPREIDILMRPIPKDLDLEVGPLECDCEDEPASELTATKRTAEKLRDLIEEQDEELQFLRNRNETLGRELMLLRD